ncbi:MAG: hypothetical protein VB996_10285 [Pseudomonadales bacterium]
MDHEPSAKNLGHIHTSLLIAYARILRTSGDINSKKDNIEAGLRARTVACILYHTTWHTPAQQVISS